MFDHGGRDSIVTQIRTRGWRSYERPIPEIVLAVVTSQPSQAALVVGANTGFYALLVAAIGIKAIAFEPHPWTADALRENVRLNRFDGRLLVIPKAVCDAEGVGLLYSPTPRPHDLECLHSLNPEFGRPCSTSTVPLTTLDHAWVSFGMPEVSIVVIDVESAEHLVLAGGERLFASQRPVVVLEVLRDAPTNELQTLVERLGYVDLSTVNGAVELSEKVTFSPVSREHVLLPAERADALVRILCPIARQQASGGKGGRRADMSASNEDAVPGDAARPLRGFASSGDVPSTSSDRTLALNALLVQWESMRDESIAALHHKIQIVSFAAGAVAVVVAGLATSDFSPYSVSALCLTAVPLLSTCAAFIWLGEHERSQRAGVGLCSVELLINRLIGFDRLMYWESHLNERRRVSGVRMRPQHIAAMLVIFGTGMFSQTFGSILLGSHIGLGRTHGTALFLVVVVAFIFLDAVV